MSHMSEQDIDRQNERTDSALTPGRCERCGTKLDDYNSSYDAWLLGTSYDADGQPIESGEEVDKETSCGHQYIVIGECCKDVVQSAWATLYGNLTGNGILDDNVRPHRMGVDVVDVRDSRTTWLWLHGSGTDYVEIDPIHLVINMAENCYTGEERVELVKLLQRLERNLNARITAEMLGAPEEGDEGEDNE